jgi:hypothetical protein
MKMKTTLAVLTALTVAVSAFGQGQLVFRNTPDTPVIDSLTGAKALPGVAIAGLYYTTDTAATPSVTPPLDSWTLAATTAIAPVEAFAGVYSGGTVTITGVDPGTSVLVQVRAWGAAYADYSGPWTAGEGLVGASNVMQVNLGGGSIPVPNISTIAEAFTLTPVPEPSTIALGLVGGLGALLLIRRRK